MIGRKKIFTRAKLSILLGLIYGVVNFVFDLDTFHKIVFLYCLVKIMDVLIDYIEIENS